MVAFGFGGIIIGGLIGMGIISILPVDASFNLNWFFIAPAVGMLLGLIAGIWFASSKTTTQTSSPNASTGIGLSQNITGWTLAILIAIGVLAGLIF